MSRVAFREGSAAQEGLQTVFSRCSCDHNHFKKAMCEREGRPRCEWRHAALHAAWRGQAVQGRGLYQISYQQHGFALLVAPLLRLASAACLWLPVAAVDIGHAAAGDDALELLQNRPQHRVLPQRFLQCRVLLLSVSRRPASSLTSSETGVYGGVPTNANLGWG